ncbi:MAG TPA: hypothetical protein VH813_04875 [Candidatus Limnocylindrales bacterium]|jgi:hypothetical protein
MTIEVGIEVGGKRTFASAIAWPGWARGARGEADALDLLACYGPRYAAALGSMAGDLEVPSGPDDLVVVERVPGSGGTDFGVPSRVMDRDRAPVDETELQHQIAILSATWTTFDAAAQAAVGAVLRKGPRGGGRDLDAIVDHVLEAERAYLVQIGGENRTLQDATPEARMADLRARVRESLADRVRGEPPPPRRRAPLWPVRYFVRRSAWHALDHTWEIEDRAAPEP